MVDTCNIGWITNRASIIVRSMMEWADGNFSEWKVKQLSGKTAELSTQLQEARVSGTKEIIRPLNSKKTKLEKHNDRLTCLAMELDGCIEFEEELNECLEE
jgi:hypothetical protein